MRIFRKITERLEQFYRDNGKYALLIDGARRVGKPVVERKDRLWLHSVVAIPGLNPANLLYWPEGVGASPIDGDKHHLISMRHLTYTVL